MGKIRYVCLSDMHLGEEDSLMTNVKPGAVDPITGKPVLITNDSSVVMKKLVECLKDVIGKCNGDNKDKPIFILNGDSLDLAFSRTEVAAAMFEQFLKLVMVDNQLFSDIIYIPGNHDHHIWVTARELQYARHISPGAQNNILPLDPPWDTTKMFSDLNKNELVASPLLTSLAKRLGLQKDIMVAYPNFGVINDDNRCVIFDHGHYTEPSLYMMMTNVSDMMFDRPKISRATWDVERENTAWIDFVWSMFGQLGDVSDDAETLYETLRDAKTREKAITTLVDNIADKTDLPGPDVATKFVLKELLLYYAKQLTATQRSQPDMSPSSQGRKGLYDYLSGSNGPLYLQMMDELGKKEKPLKVSDLKDVSFVYGHTHLPYEDDENFIGYDGFVNIYNTGGWIIESMVAEPRRGGSVLLVDDKLDVVALRMYNESKAGEYQVALKEARHAGGSVNSFYSELLANGGLDFTKGPWADFSVYVNSEIQIRQKNLGLELHGKGRK